MKDFDEDGRTFCAVECLFSDDMTVGVNSGAKQFWFWSYSTSLEGVLADSDEDDSRRGTLLRKFRMQKLNRISTAETQFIQSKIRVTGLHMEEDFHVCYSTLQKQVDVQMASNTDVFLRAAEQVDSRTELSNAERCTCSQRRRRFKKRNIVEKIQVPGVDREMCLKKEFHYCDLTLQKQGLSCSEGKEDFKKESLLQLRSINKICCKDVLTACDRKEIQQLCFDSSHETYIAVTVPQWVKKETNTGFKKKIGCLKSAQNMSVAVLPVVGQMSAMLDCGLKKIASRRIVYKIQTRTTLTCQVYYQASSDNKAPLWKQQNKHCQFANLDVDTE
ncbi:hypothetical protein DPMN_151441 [Dreissena polymorpha]|uniref:Uncharacterized protein n=1 Tax=Dreissena polymorpha TaxID=45954 RepID=A0A9D4J6Y7_DREPO|nr:hypothetical protein DPMN_151441 [Dreissena polymorpha]